MRPNMLIGHTCMSTHNGQTWKSIDHVYMYISLVLRNSLVLIFLAPLDILSYSRDARLRRSALLEPASRRVKGTRTSCMHVCPTCLLANILIFLNRDSRWRKLQNKSPLLAFLAFLFSSRRRSSPRLAHKYISIRRFSWLWHHWPIPPVLGAAYQILMSIRSYQLVSHFQNSII